LEVGDAFVFVNDSTICKASFGSAISSNLVKLTHSIESRGNKDIPGQYTTVSDGISEGSYVIKSQSGYKIIKGGLKVVFTDPTSIEKLTCNIHFTRGTLNNSTPGFYDCVLTLDPCFTDEIVLEMSEGSSLENFQWILTLVPDNYSIALMDANGNVSASGITIDDIAAKVVTQTQATIKECNINEYLGSGDNEYNSVSNDFNIYTGNTSTT